MNKATLIAKVAEKSELSKKQAEASAEGGKCFHGYLPMGQDSFLRYLSNTESKLSVGPHQSLLRIITNSKGKKEFDGFAMFSAIKETLQNYFGNDKFDIIDL